MSMPAGLLARFAPCGLALTLACTAAGQQPPPPGGTSPAKPVEIKGEARVSVHPYKMEKGTTYRITVKAETFSPEVRIEGQPEAFGNSLGSTFLDPEAAKKPGFSNRTAHLLFTANATREFQIKVDCSPASDIAKGPNPYTLTIERAAFAARIAASAQLDLPQTSKKLEQGKIYSITVKGIGFAPEVQIMDGNRPVLTAFNGRWYGFGPDSEFITTMTFAPNKTQEYRLVIAIGPVALENKGALPYSTQIVELKTALSASDKLTTQDPTHPRRGGPFKAHAVKLEAGKNYQIDMMTKAFDAYLFLEDAAGTTLMEDDDSGEGLNARLIFRPARTDTYRIVATTFNRGSPASALGAYTLTVVENPHAEPRFPTRYPTGKGALDFKK